MTTSSLTSPPHSSSSFLPYFSAFYGETPCSIYRGRDAPPQPIAGSPSNGIRIGAELEYLAGRIVFDRDKPAVATAAAQRLLRNDGIVSITAGAWEGLRLAEIDLLGGKLELAVGAPGLARLTGAALLPVFTVRGPDVNALQVIIEKPLSIPEEANKDEALQAAAQQFGELLENYVLRYPTEWRDWKNLKLPA